MPLTCPNTGSTDEFSLEYVSRPFFVRSLLAPASLHYIHCFVVASCVTSAKHNINRVSRLVRNRRVSMAEDEKNIRYGWGLRQMKPGTAERMERLLLVLAFAYLVLLLIGLA